ncbi:MAG TPA: hypothetical protein VFC19_16425 [Candidatus Limnocylindrales bacterium]|nr:hypothetical protein [Candidatus Limnocylindrales bacterium]
MRLHSSRPQVDREQLAQLLPAPAERDLPESRHHVLREYLMNEIHHQTVAQRTTRMVAVRPRWLAPWLATAAAALSLGALALLPAKDGTTPGHQPDAATGQAATPYEVRHASFTLVRNADDSITFTALQLVDAAAATQALNGAGIAGRVLTNDLSCTAGPGGHGQIDPANLYPADTLREKHTGLDASDTVTFRSSDYPQGGGLLLAVGQPTGTGTKASTGYAVGVFAYADADNIPTCINFIDPGTGQ